MNTQRKVIVSMTEDFLKEMDDFVYKNNYNRSEFIRIAVRSFIENELSRYTT